MKRFYLTGHNNLGNRGCEAIVRGTVALLREVFGEIEVLVPSIDIRRDRAQWPKANQLGVRFVPAFTPLYSRCWIHLQRLPVSALKRAGWPFPLPKGLRKVLVEVDAVLSVGGDNYSLDYRLPTPLMGLDAGAMDAGTPTVLWGASVGPFESEPDFLPVIREHLQRFSFVAVRESVTIDYLQKLRLANVLLAADPAFAMEPEVVNISPFWPVDDDGVLGLNLSPLLQRYRPVDEGPRYLLNETAIFVRHVVKETGMGVLLIPHVMPLDGARKNNDAIYMEGIFKRTADMGGRVRMMDVRLNASQIKHVISQCRFFVGSRTHATIAAFSSGVPTISIAYSIKAKGINRDLFGQTDYVLETPKVSARSLRIALERLLKDELILREILVPKKDEWRHKAALPAKRLAKIMK